MARTIPFQRYTPTLTPEQLARRRILFAPIDFKIVEPKSWAGCNCGHSFAGAIPVEGRRTWHVSHEDESYWTALFKEDVQ